jgi:hypothetical protein
MKPAISTPGATAKHISVFAAALLLAFVSVSPQASGINPYETNIVSWGSMQMLDQPAIAIAAGGVRTVALK